MKPKYKKPKTQKQADRATDLRLQKTYGITLEERSKLDEFNEGKCWICDRPPVKVRLSVDHDHSWKKVKITHLKLDDGYIASASYNGNGYTSATHPKKAAASAEVRRKLLKASVRGLLCVWCNRGLKYYRDSAKYLYNAGAYLENFKSGRTLERLEK